MCCGDPASATREGAPVTVRLASLAFFVALPAMLAFGPAAGHALAAELVMFETDDCPWCRAWDREVGVVYHKTEAGRRAPLRRVDVHGPRPPDLEQVEGIVFTPTFVLLVDGREIGRILGYPGDNHFWGLLDAMLDDLPDAPRSGLFGKQGAPKGRS